MNENEKRATLAKVMGWTHGMVECTIREFELKQNLTTPGWTTPDGQIYPDYRYDSEFSVLPNPFTDANDCDALKMWLRDRGWHIEIRWQAHTNLCPAPAVYVEIWHEASEIHHRYDSDRGEPFTVSMAAIKVIE